MNIKLSDEECSRWICEKLEPLASLPKPDEFVNRKDRRHGSDPEDAPKYWKMMQRFRSTFEYGWQPRDMVNDPAMTVMLIQQLLGGRDYECIISQDEIEMCWRPSVVTSGQSFMVSLIGKSLGRGVCEAFMLASGYKEQQ